MAEAIRAGAAFSEIAGFMCNDFQALCEKRCAEIRTLCTQLADKGWYAQMSGSGSAVFGVRSKNTQ